MKRSALYRLLALAALASCFALSLLGCVTKKPLAPAEAPPAQAAPAPESPREAPPLPPAASPPAPIREESDIVPDGAGFWPAPESRARTISFALLIGNADLAGSWKVEIAPASKGEGKATRSFKGAASPASLAWDGRGDDGKLAPEGAYEAALSVEYSDPRLPAARVASKPFALSLSPPEPMLAANPARIDLAAAGAKGIVSFEIDASSAFARLDSWRLDLVGPDGRLFRGFEGSWPESGAPAPIAWDGRSDAGEAVLPGRHYAAILSVLDGYGHAGATQADIAVADLPYPSERSSVEPWTSGFSPNGDQVMDQMDLSLGFGQRSAVRSWRLEIAHAEKGMVRVFRGDAPRAGGTAPELPASISWDGKSASGEPAPEGRYVASLYVDYGSSFSPAVARSPAFILDVTPPELRLSSSPALFSPDASPPSTARGPADPSSVLTLGLEASSRLARIADWSIEIIDPGDRVFARFGGSWPAAGKLPPISWDGMGTDGSLVESAEAYGIVARARDEFGNESRATGGVETDILVVKSGDLYRVDVASIVFKGYTDDFNDLPAEQSTQNRLTLDRLAAKFSKFPDYRIRLVGHAVMINWDDPNLGKPEQAAILVPLSRARAAAIAKALAARGIDPARMAIAGVGSADPVVPDSDLVNRWKNRRVEFYLEKR